VDITLEQQQREKMETPEIVKNRILRAAETLGDPRLVYVAPDCGRITLRASASVKARLASYRNLLGLSPYCDLNDSR